MQTEIVTRLTASLCEAESIVTNLRYNLSLAQQCPESPPTLHRTQEIATSMRRLLTEIQHMRLMAQFAERGEGDASTCTPSGMWTSNGRFIFRFEHIPTEAEKNQLSSVGSGSMSYSMDLAQAVRSNAEAPTPVFLARRFLVQFVHVYGAAKQGTCVPDNDNYAYKHYIDLVADALGRGDGGDVCSLRFDTFFSDAIPEGSYCIASSDINAHLTLEALIAAVSLDPNGIAKAP